MPQENVAHILAAALLEHSNIVALSGETGLTYVRCRYCRYDNENLVFPKVLNYHADDCPVLVAKAVLLGTIKT